MSHKFVKIPTPGGHIVDPRGEYYRCEVCGLLCLECIGDEKILIISGANEPYETAWNPDEVNCLERVIREIIE